MYYRKLILDKTKSFHNPGPKEYESFFIRLLIVLLINFIKKLRNSNEAYTYVLSKARDDKEENYFGEFER